MRPRIFPKWVHTIGRGLDYSQHGSTPLAEAWNMPGLWPHQTKSASLGSLVHPSFTRSLLVLHPLHRGRETVRRG
eukprot:9261178-Pyramimonas_sp.AAC.2